MTFVPFRATFLRFFAETGTFTVADFPAPTFAFFDPRTTGFFAFVRRRTVVLQTTDLPHATCTPTVFLPFSARRLLLIVAVGFVAGVWVPLPPPVVPPPPPPSTGGTVLPQVWRVPVFAHHE